MTSLIAFADAEGGSAVPFPPPRNLVEWPAFLFDGSPIAFNKIRPRL